LAGQRGPGRPGLLLVRLSGSGGLRRRQGRAGRRRFDAALGEFLLPYEAVRTAPDPDAALLAFLQTTYEAAANLAHWDRAALECAEGVPGVPRPVGAP
jgi:hypothetical protein